jgi:signal transduction histidine kinase
MALLTTAFPVYQLLLLASAGLSVLFFYYCVQYREKRGVTSLIVLFLGITIWIASELVQIQLQDPAYAGFGMAIRILGLEVTVIGIFLLGLEYTGRERLLSWKLAAALSVVPLLEAGLSLSPWRTVFFDTRVAEGVPWGYEIVQTPLFLAHTVHSYLFVLVSVALLVAMMVRTNAGYRRQLAAVLVAVLFPTAVNLLFHFDVVPFDLTPVSFVVTAAVLMFATFRLRLLDTIPVARRTVLEEMEDMVVVLDENDEVMTANAAVQDTFDLAGQPTGEHVADLFETDPSEPIVPPDGKRELDVTIAGEPRSINVEASPITDHRGNLLARVLVCRDVTEQRRREEQLRRREEELELLKDLQSRFLRHNLRNELNVVRANAELLADTDDPTERERYGTILDKTDRILEWTTKARTIERLVETTATVDRDAIADIREVVEDLRAEYPAVEFELDDEDPVWIAAVPQVERAFRDVLDNAARHNTAAEPRVSVAIDRGEDRVAIRISDNGPGIEPYETETLRDEQETQLQHGTGLGLWLVYWVVEKSGGALSFDVDDGTTVTLTFDRGTPPAERTGSERTDRPEEAPVGAE